jgi:hypothetical protein
LREDAQAGDSGGEHGGQQRDFDAGNERVAPHREIDPGNFVALHRDKTRLGPTEVSAIGGPKGEAAEQNDPRAPLERSNEGRF